MSESIKDYPLYLANAKKITDDKLSVYDKYTQKLAAKVSMADVSMLKEAVSLAVKAAEPLRKMYSFERKNILQHCVKRLKERTDELVDVICTEVGKPKQDAIGEVRRTIGTFQESMEESTRIYGEILPLDLGPKGKGFQGFWKRVPIGPCLFITPFNFPLNLVAHKVAPAIACGCPFILKPASITPISALILGEILAETDLPPGSFSILPCKTEDVSHLVKSDELKLLSFTGSSKVGWELKKEAGKKVVILELGGNAACVVDENVNIDAVVEKLAWGGYYMSGQSCISVQRIYAHQNIYNQLKDKLISKLKNLKIGDPKQDDTFIGPMISIDAAKRVESWIKEACDAGAKLLYGGERKDAILTPAILEGVKDDQKLSCEEAFGPVTTLTPFTEFSKALEAVNNSRYGLQAGVFTRDLGKTLEAWDTLQVGGVIVNEVSSWRSDNMPYGGVKDSGLGREGVRFAIEHLTEIRLLALHGPL